MKDWLGQAQLRAGEFIFRRAPGYRAHLLSFWTEGGSSLGPLEKWLFAGLSRAIDQRYYDAAASTKDRETIKALCMARSSAVKWARHYLSLGFPDRYTPALKMFDEIESLLASGSVQIVRQVACCSGREIAYFARRYPQIEFAGSDCDEALIDFLREHWKHLSNLTFDLVRLEEEQLADSAQAKVRSPLRQRRLSLPGPGLTAPLFTAGSTFGRPSISLPAHEPLLRRRKGARLSTPRTAQLESSLSGLFKGGRLDERAPDRGTGRRIAPAEKRGGVCGVAIRVPTSSSKLVLESAG